MRDFRCKENNQSFGVRAAALIVVDNKILFMTDGNRYYLPGGAVCVNETSQQAVVREIKEELHITVEVDKLLFVVENFFNHNDMMYHNIEFHYMCVTNDKLPHIAIENDYTMQVVLIPLSDLALYDIRPSFLKEKLVDFKQPVSHIINKGV